MPAAIKARELRSGDWPIVERLFGPRGACGGCWCMVWRVRGAKAWEAAKGEKNRRALKRLIERGEVHGCLAFSGDEPVGWCCIGPKTDFEKLMHSKVLATDHGPKTWGVTCFFIPTAWRGRGVAGALLKEAVAVARRRGAAELEGYPVVPYEQKMPAAFAWTGVPALFERAGFRVATPPGRKRPIYLKRF